MTETITASQPDCDYVVVGSGAGGGTIAARLAQAGYRVVLLEAGGDPRDPSGSDAGHDRLPDDYDVPAFHPMASENDAINWHFFVRHYADTAQQKRDPAYCAEWDGKPVDGVLYPRAACLGGCTAHNALILVAPHAADWDGIATLTGDPSWQSDRMARYFTRIEDCRHRWFWRLFGRLGSQVTGHGWSGWLRTEKAHPLQVLGDRALVKVIIDTALTTLREVGVATSRLRVLLRSFLDPNDRRVTDTGTEGLFYAPLTTSRGRRHAVRERLLDIARRAPDRLTIRLNALATRVLFDADNRAIGVEYLDGARLYRAHREPADGDAQVRVVRAAKEVILAGGAFNTPQLLMLSGIGPRASLEALGIQVRRDLPEVGRNLQDRYEVGVISRMAFQHWTSLRGATFTRDDPQYRDWANRHSGMYTSNGAVLSVAARSDRAKPLPDLYCMALLGCFKGYYPGYSRTLIERQDCLTWSVLKAYTENRAGTVALRTRDPRDPPAVTFHSFQEGSDTAGEDLRAMIAGIRLARAMTEKLSRTGLVAEEELPGEHLQSDEALGQFIRDHAWGHHACGTCAIGPVLDSDFRVHGTNGLRVVDASVFPRIPGFFIASAVYMIAEKAADVVLAD